MAKEQTIIVMCSDLRETTEWPLESCRPDDGFTVHFGGNRPPYVTRLGQYVGELTLEQLAAFDREGGLP